MTQEYFVDMINVVVKDAAVKSVHSTLLDPPGRSPDPELVKMSEWFCRLPPADQEMALRVVNMTSRSATFGFFCVLDNVRTIEPAGEKGEVVLTFKKDNQVYALSGWDVFPLHDMM